MELNENTYNPNVDSISTLADGIRRKTITNADLLTLSIAKSAKKRKLEHDSQATMVIPPIVNN